MFYQVVSLFYQRENDPTVDTPILVVGFRKHERQNGKFGKRAMFLTDSKADFPDLQININYSVYNIRCVAYSVTYSTNHINYSIYRIACVNKNVLDRVLYTKYIALAIGPFVGVAYSGCMDKIKGRWQRRRGPPCLAKLLSLTVEISDGCQWIASEA